jgi:hypothetical protein
VGAGDTFKPFAINLGTMWLVRLTLAYALSQRFGLLLAGGFAIMTMTSIDKLGARRERPAWATALLVLITRYNEAISMPSMGEFGDKINKYIG